MGSVQVLVRFQVQWGGTAECHIMPQYVTSGPGRSHHDSQRHILTLLGSRPPNHPTVKGIAALYRFAGATTIQPYIIAVNTRNKHSSACNTESYGG
jgi:hypothetical protein